MHQHSFIPDHAFHCPESVAQLLRMGKNFRRSGFTVALYLVLAAGLLHVLPYDHSGFAAAVGHLAT